MAPGITGLRVRRIFALISWHALSRSLGPHIMLRFKQGLAYPVPVPSLCDMGIYRLYHSPREYPTQTGSVYHNSNPRLGVASHGRCSHRARIGVALYKLSVSNTLGGLSI